MGTEIFDISLAVTKMSMGTEIFDISLAITKRLHKKEQIINLLNIIYKNIGGKKYGQNFKENFWSMFSRIWIRNIISFIASNNRLVICYRINYNMCRIYLVSMLKERRNTYDYCSKKGSKVFKRNCKIYI